MKKNYNKRMIAATCILMLGSTYHTSASGFTDASATPRVSTRGNFSNVKAEGDINQTFNDHGPKGGNAFINLGGGQEREKKPQDYFEEGKMHFNKVPPDYLNAATCFLQAAGAEQQHIKVESYLHYAKCMFNTEPDKARTFYKKVLAIEEFDEAYRGLMMLDYGLGLEADDDPEYFQEVLERANSYGKKIGAKNKEDRTFLRDIQKKLSTLSLKPSAAVEAAFSHLSLSGDQKPSAEQSFTDDGDVSTLSGGSLKGSNIKDLIDDAECGDEDALSSLMSLAENGDVSACMALISFYKEGDIVDQSDERVFHFAEKAAKSKHKEAQFEVAECYRLGKGVEANSKLADRYYKFASKQGHERAKAILEGALERERAAIEEESNKKRQAEETRLSQERQRIERETKQKADLERQALEQERQKIEEEKKELAKAELQRRQAEETRLSQERQRIEREAKQKADLERQALEQERQKIEAEKKELLEAKKKAESDQKSVGKMPSTPSPVSAVAAPAPMVMTVASPQRSLSRVYPEIARGYEQIYERFMNGALVYKPNSTNDVGKLTFPFRDWVNPETLRGTCPLSTCGDAGNYLIINSGYRTQKSGQSKVEVFITPRFLVEKEMGKTLGHYSVHSQKWTSEVGILFSWGTWDDNSWGVYQTKDTFDEISSQSLYQIIEKSPASMTSIPFGHYTPCMWFASSKIFIQFLDNI